MKPRARNTDPQTSHKAAASITQIPHRQQVILNLLRKFGPMSDAQLEQRAWESGIMQSGSGLRTRRRELCDRGLVIDSGQRTSSYSGRNMIVWALTPRPTDPRDVA